MHFLPIVKECMSDMDRSPGTELGKLKVCAANQHMHTPHTIGKFDVHTFTVTLLVVLSIDCC